MYVTFLYLIYEIGSGCDTTFFKCEYSLHFGNY